MATNLDTCNRKYEYADEVSFLNLANTKRQLRIPNLSQNFFNRQWIEYGVDNYWEPAGCLINNLVPQLIRELSFAPLNGLCMQLKSNLAIGQGLEYSQELPEKAALDEFFNKAIEPNCDNFTINDFLRKLAYDYCCFGGFSFNVRLDRGISLDGRTEDPERRKVAALDYMPYECYRLAIPDKFLKISHVYYSYKWPDYMLKSEYKPKKLPIFDGYKKDGIQVYYNRADRYGANYYPLPQWWAAFNYIQAAIQMAEYMNVALQNSFVIGAFIAYPYDQPLEVKDDNSDMLRAQHVGTRNANKIFEAYGTTDAEGKGVAPIITPINANDNAGIYRDSYELACKNILNQHSVPTTLMDFKSNSNLVVNSQQYRDGIRVMTPIINEIRNKVLGSMKAILRFNSKVDPRLTEKAINSLKFIDLNYGWENN